MILADQTTQETTSTSYLGFALLAEVPKHDGMKTPVKADKDNDINQGQVCYMERKKNDYSRA